METPYEPRSYSERLQMQKEWDELRKTILKTTIKSLHTNESIWKRWIPIKHLFSKELCTIPQKVSSKAFGSIWKRLSQLTNQSYVFKEELSNGQTALLLRHQFRCSYHLWFQMLLPHDGQNDYLKIANAAVADYSIHETVQIHELEKIHSMLQDSSLMIEAPPPFRVAKIVTLDAQHDNMIQYRSRSDMQISNICSSTNPLSAFRNLRPTQQSSVLIGLAKMFNDKEKNYDEFLPKSLLRHLLNYGFTFSAKSFVNNIVEGKVAFPARFDSQHPKVKEKIASVTTDIIEIYINAFTDNVHDNGVELVNLATSSKKFSRLILPSTPSSSLCNIKKEEFQSNPIVQAIKKVVESLRQYGQDKKDKEQLLSLFVEIYPQSWLQDFFGVGRISIHNAKKHAEDYGVGFPIPDVMQKSFTRISRIDVTRTKFTLQWFHDNENTEASPCVRRSSSTGKLMNHTTLYRVLNRNSGYEKYIMDAKKADVKPVSRSHFYKMDHDVGLVDSKSDSGLCPTCHRFGTETYAKIHNVLTFMIQCPKKLSEMKKDLMEFQKYFKRGGKFYYSLQQTSSCIDWCMRFNLSDPFCIEFQSCFSLHDDSEKDRHVHTSRDDTVMRMDQFFKSMIDTAYVEADAVIKEMKVIVIDDLDKTEVLYKVKHMQNGIVTLMFTKEDPQLCTCQRPWYALKDQLSKRDFDYLCLVDTCYDLRDKHRRYLRHLYLDRNQTYGELTVMEQTEYVGVLDYMMKLRSKIWKSDSSKFHLLMNKGTSVHVFCIKRRVSENEAIAEINNVASAKGEKLLQKGDFKIVWIDSFSSNTTQGGYETLCTIQACTKKGTEIFNNMKEIALVSDAGSGYKTAQSILGVRGMQSLAGCRVKLWIFNASGEGKRWETDHGHNTQIKARREMAMRAGKPADCVTPEKETEAQKYGGGIPGSYPYVLEFDYENEAQITTWKGIQNYHYFKFNLDRSITVWRTYGIGIGKTYSKEELDKLYPKYKADSKELPQGDTGSRLITVGEEESKKAAPHFSRKRKMKDESEKIEKKIKREQGRKEAVKTKKKIVHGRMGRTFFCALCEKGFVTEVDLEDHVCTVDTELEDVSTAEEESTIGCTSLKVKDELFTTPTTTDVCIHEMDHIPMGRGLQLHRGTGVTDEGVKLLVQQEVEKGNVKVVQVGLRTHNLRTSVRKAPEQYNGENKGTARNQLSHHHNYINTKPF